MKVDKHFRCTYNANLNENLEKLASFWASEQLSLSQCRSENLTASNGSEEAKKATRMVFNIVITSGMPIYWFGILLANEFSIEHKHVAHVAEKIIR